MGRDKVTHFLNNELIMSGNLKPFQFIPTSRNNKNIDNIAKAQEEYLANILKYLILTTKMEL